MSQIQEITHLNHGVLRDFDWPRELARFGRYNLIYGPNASGKTTISTIFRHLEQGRVPEANVKLCIDNREVTGQDFSNESDISIRVFNRDFVSENIFHNNREKDVPHILVLGEKSIQKQKQLEKRYEDKRDMQTEKNENNNQLMQASNDLDKHCSKGASVVKDTLLQHDSEGYRNYDRRNYKRRVREIANADSIGEHKLPPKTSTELYGRIKENLKPPIREVRALIPPINGIREEVATILAETVGSTVLQSLKEDTTLGSWVREGLKLHRERNPQLCLFCNQSIPEQRLAKLEGHFNDAHDHFLQKIDRLIKKYEKIIEDIGNRSLPEQSKFYGELEGDYATAKTSVEQAFERWSGFFRMMVKKLKEKRDRPFINMELGIEVPTIDGDPVSKVNKVIRRHNQVHDDFQSRKSEAIKRLEADLVAQRYDEFQQYSETKKNLKSNAESLQRQLDEIDSEIDHLEKDIREYRKPAEELNNELQEYLGHNELRLKAKDTGYQIMRGDSPGDALSEGEKTALALLYFLKTLKDQRFELNNGIVVLDDPVSSLDSNFLYLAFGYIKDRTRDASQLFVMTHNFTFFQNVKRWFYHAGDKKHKKCKGTGECQCVGGKCLRSRYYMLDRATRSGPRKMKLTELDSLLRDYHSEYHYLFAQVYQRVYDSSPINYSFEFDYGFANTARRILEMFFAFCRPDLVPEGSFYRKIDSVDFDQAKKSRIEQFVNRYSHADQIGGPEHNASILCETKSILEDVLKLIESENKNHYDRMVCTVRASHDP